MARRKVGRVFAREFKLKVLREIDTDASLAQAARNHDVHPKTIRL
jgi:transposase-like protein